MGRALGFTVALLAVLSGCAPSTLSPMAMRMVPGLPDGVGKRAGVRAGPRLSVPIARPEDFEGNRKPFAFPQWAVAYELELLVPLGGGTGMHVGFQGELGCEFANEACPVPVPGYGMSLGLSEYFQAGPVSVAPAVTLRGATDFGLATYGGPGSIIGVEASATLALHSEGTAVGIVPFLGVHRLVGTGRDVSATYAGAAIAGHFDIGDGQFLELSAGAGLVRMRGVPDWWVPLFGITGGP